MRNVNGHSIYEFEDFRLDVDKLMLYRNEAEVALPPKVVKTLSVLVENGGEILSKDELMKRVWEDSIVEESNLSQYLYLLRKTVGNKPDGTPYIETLRRRGYRFTGDVTVVRDARPRGDHRTLDLPQLVGREKEIDEVISLLQRSDVRLVTLSGVGGVGKTSLARAVAGRWSGSEVVFVELAALTRSEHVISTIASTLGLKESTSESLVNGVKAKLQKRPHLLVLDNFEQVASGAPDLEKLFGPGPSDLKALVTSRVPLRIAREILYPLRPLAIPLNASDDVSALRECESVALFRERSRMVQPSFEISSENVSDVAEICRRLEGLPLAIELAAARTNLMSPEAMRNRLVQQLDILTGGPNEAPKRQQTMRDTIAWSYHLLSENDQAVFASLGIFSGGFDLEAAESVCAELVKNSGVSVLDSLSSLVEQNLLVIRTDSVGDPRIYMLEIVREFAKEVLSKKDELGSAESAHAEYFLALAEKAEPMLVAARSAAWLDRLEKEHDNLRAALAWAIDHEPSVGQRIAGAIWRFWWLHGHIREAREQLEQLIDVANTPPTIKAKMLTGATFLARLAGDSSRSRQFAEEGVELAEAANDLRNGALAYCQLGFLALDVKDFSEAGRMFRTGLKQAEELDDIQILALLNNGLGELSRSKGEFEKAAEFYGKALEFNRAAGDLVRQTTCLINLGATALMLGEREQAGRFYRQGLEISSEMEDMNGTLYCLEGLAGSFWARHDPERAAIIFGAAHCGRQENDLLLEPADQRPYEESVALVRTEIGPDLFDKRFSEGTALKLSEAVDKAIIGSEDRPTPIVRPEPAFRTGRVAVERQGNVLRLVEWSESGEPENSAEVAPESIKETSHGSSLTVTIAASVAALILLTLVSAFVWVGTNSSSTAGTGQQNVIRLTNGLEPRGATISHDGKYFVYHESGPEYRMWLQQTGYSSRVEIIPASDKAICCISFSPDDQFIYYLASDSSRDPNSLFRVPTLGGPAARILTNVNSAVSFSPDGREVIYSRYEKQKNETQYVIRASDGSGGERIVYTAEGSFAAGPAWSPDGNTIVLARSFSGEDGDYVLTALAVADGSIKYVSDESWDMVYRILWSGDGRGVYFVGTKKGERLTTRRDQLYYVSFLDGRSRRITTDPTSRQQPDSLGVTSDDSILTVPYNRASQIWVMDAKGDSRSAVQLTTGTSDGRAGMAQLSDGRLAFIGLSGDNTAIFVTNQDGTERKALLADGLIPDEPRSSRGSPYLIFSIYDWPYSHIYRSNMDGSEMTQLTFGKSREIDSSVSNDGKWVAYGSLAVPVTETDISLWKVSIHGGEPVRLKQNNCLMPHFSPDDKLLSCVEDQKTIHILSASDGSLIKSIPVTPLAWLNSGARWTPDGKAVGYIVTEKGVSNIWLHPIDGGEPKPLTDFKIASIYNFAYSTDGSRLFIARGQQIRDAVLIQNH